jgi:hypothetical protein
MLVPKYLTLRENLKLLSNLQTQNAVPLATAI